MTTFTGFKDIVAIAAPSALAAICRKNLLSALKFLVDCCEDEADKGRDEEEGVVGDEFTDVENNEAGVAVRVHEFEYEQPPHIDKIAAQEHPIANLFRCVQVQLFKLFMHIVTDSRLIFSHYLYLLHEVKHNQTLTQYTLGTATITHTA